MNGDVEFATESVINKIKHYLITTMGRTSENATDQEFYKAFCSALREEVMINWTATSHSFKLAKTRKLYYLSMEYMPGRLLGNTLTNISATALVKNVLVHMNRDFSKMMFIEPEISIGNGGLGRLASCFLDSLATLQYPALAYGMRYQYGIFEQEMMRGLQIERPECWLLFENPWELRRDNHAVKVDFCGRPTAGRNTQGEQIFDLLDPEEVRALPYDIPVIGYQSLDDFLVLTLRLWSTKESPHNFQLQRYNAGQLDQAAENTNLTDVLYPNDNNEAGKRIRLKQEFLLVSASIQDITHEHLRTFGNMTQFKDKVRIQINDTHPALVIAELMRLLVKEHQFSWTAAWETTQECCSYTNHTVLKEALEEWNQNRLEYLLPRQYHIISTLNQTLCDSIRSKYPGDEEKIKRVSIIENGQVRMANLAIYGSHKVNGVAKLHSDILKKWIFKDFDELYPEKFTNVTNGVTQRRWLLHSNPKLADFITKRIGNGWITNFKEITKLAAYASDEASLNEFLAIKKENKKALIGFLNEELDDIDHRQNISLYLGEDALFDVQIKRFHEYKRQLMNVLHTLMLYHEIKQNPKSHKVKRMVIFAGKAAPGYKIAKDVLRLIYCLSRKINADPIVRDSLQVIFIQNYNVSKAEKIIPAADLSQQISTAGMEASGTGNMKLSINGALTIGTEDGANIEMREAITNDWWPFSFGKSADENREMLRTRSYKPWEICSENSQIREAVESLRNGSLTEDDSEHESLCNLYHSLLESPPGGYPDRFFVLSDLQKYYETQKHVESLYLQPLKWAEYAIHNIAGMGLFSSDESIRNYATNIWGLSPCPLNKVELERIRQEYTDLDRCRILPSKKLKM